MEERPEFVTDEMLDFLDVLRLTGVTNMLGACPYLMDEFDLTRHEAPVVLQHWMHTFSERTAARTVSAETLKVAS